MKRVGLLLKKLKMKKRKQYEQQYKQLTIQHIMMNEQIATVRAEKELGSFNLFINWECP